MRQPNADVNIAVTFRHTEPTAALKSYAADKLLNCLKKYVLYDADVQVVLSVEKRDHVAEVQVKSKGYDVAAKAVTADLYSSIDKVSDTLVTQLRKRKERIKTRKQQAATKETVVPQ